MFLRTGHYKGCRLWEFGVLIDTYISQSDNSGINQMFALQLEE